MNDEQYKALDNVLLALCFYSNANIYWGKPMDLEIKKDLATLKIANESHKSSEIMKDRGKLAREALFEFEGVFDCKYEFRTEI
jgi:hypothetical protein